MRKYPVVPIITRRSTKDYNIPNTNVTLKNGTLVMIPIKAIHWDEEVYENPSKFDPDRFSVENKQNRHSYSHLPFGEGPRICIGESANLSQLP